MVEQLRLTHILIFYWSAENCFLFICSMEIRTELFTFFKLLEAYSVPIRNKAALIKSLGKRGTMLVLVNMKFGLEDLYLKCTVLRGPSAYNLALTPRYITW